MLLASVIVLFVASAIFIAISSFTKKRGVSFVVFSSLAIISLAVTMILSANYNNNFFGFAIINMISVVPLFLTLFDFKEKLDKKQLEYEAQSQNAGENAANAKENSAEVSENQSEETVAASTDEKKKKKDRKNKKSALLLFSESEGRLFESFALFLSAFLVAFSGLYLGKESPFGMLVGIPAGILGLAVTYLKDRNANIFDGISNALSYAGAGMLLGQIVSVIIYGFSASAIVYLIACLALIAYTLACVYTKKRRINVILYLVYLLLAVAIILY